MDKILTFSVASYNIEKYMDKLMNSLLDARVLDDIEILIVNDGSKDNTLKMAKEYEKKYPNTVKAIDKPNGGHGSTINKGIELASGKYFRALDGDDWVDTDGLVELVNKLKTCDSDMVLCKMKYCYEGTDKEALEGFDSIKTDYEYKFEDVCLNIGWMRYHVIIFKTEILQKHSIRLDEKIFYVDTEYDIYPIPYVDTIIYYDLVLYCYRIGYNEQSVSTSSRQKNITHSQTVTKNIVSFYNDKKNELTPNKKAYILDGIVNLAIFHFNSLFTFKTSKESKQRVVVYANEIANNVPEIIPLISEKSKSLQFLFKNPKKNYFITKAYKIFKKENDQ